MRQKGGSTVFEAWECDVCRSCCHYAFGATDNRIMTHIAGIHQLAPGYSEVKINPQLPDDMDYLKFAIDTVRGTIEVNCRRNNGKVTTNITVPDTIKVVE